MSSSDLAISVRGLSKSYTLAHERETHSTLAETLLHGARNAFQRKPKETFWALNDLSFDIKKGDVVGIIGRNGAGKSTLLKILSRITEPTSGEIDLYGRVGSLLEVGTGFHPELTGRENIFLNGAILGMAKGEIRKQFDAIVDFANVEKFLDTPVKRYSSGMYVRLAFAVAAHLNPDILIVDEVLAVGDAEFQQKCLGKMKDVASGGRTVLFVSHNMAAVVRLCRTVCWLSNGSLKEVGNTEEVIQSYLRLQNANSAVWERPHNNKGGTKPFIQYVKVAACDKDSSAPITVKDRVVVQIDVHNPASKLECQIAVRFSTLEGVPVFTTATTDAECKLTALPAGPSHFEFTIPENFVAVGCYTLICAVLLPRGELFDVVADKVLLDIHDAPNHSTHFQDGRMGALTPRLEWTHRH